MALELPQGVEDQKDEAAPIEQIFGERSRTLLRWVLAFSSIISGAGAGYALAEKMGNPVLRWTVEAALCLFCAAAGYQQRHLSQETILYSGRNRSERLTKRGVVPLVTYIAIAVFVALVADLVSTFSGVFSPVEVSEPQVNYYGDSAVFASKKDADQVAGLRCATIATVHLPTAASPNHPCKGPITFARIGFGR